jgi:PadR family transcriptional regulator, regulatory protein PadR
LAPEDGATLATVLVMLTVVALLASWRPARNAARVSPIEACEPSEAASRPAIGPSAFFARTHTHVDIRQHAAHAVGIRHDDQSRQSRSARMAASRLDLLQGTLDLLILRTLALSPMHGWAISQRIQQVSGDVLRVNQGSLYPALHRLEDAGWIDAEWGRAENNRQAKFYRLTKQGERQLKEEQRQWERMTLAVSRVLEGQA